MSNRQLIVLARKAYFSSGLIFFNRNWTSEKNFQVFGQDAQGHGHGHSFVLEARLAGFVDLSTSLVVNLSELEKDLKALLEQLDKKHLYYDVPALQDKTPTIENVAQFCYSELKKRLGSLLVGVRLTQGADDWVDILSDEASIGIPPMRK